MKYTALNAPATLRPGDTLTITHTITIDGNQTATTGPVTVHGLNWDIATDQRPAKQPSASPEWD